MKTASILCSWVATALVFIAFALDVCGHQLGAHRCLWVVSAVYGADGALRLMGDRAVEP